MDVKKMLNKYNGERANIGLQKSKGTKWSYVVKVKRGITRGKCHNDDTKERVEISRGFYMLMLLMNNIFSDEAFII